MKTAILTGVLAAAFLILATANAGGYRYGVSDQAFHVPALAHAVDPTLFPRDAAIFAAQTRLSIGDDLIALLTPNADAIPQTFAAIYVITGLALACAGLFFARSVGASWWAVAGALALMTLRHRIARTAVNSFEGHMSPRMLAFAVGLAALACIVRGRLTAAAALCVAAGAVHPTSGLWFGAVLIVAAVVQANRRPVWIGMAGAIVAGLALVVAVSPRMDAEWLRAIGEKDYLFPTEWPLYAWVLNLSYPVVLWVLFSRRRAQGRALPGEWPLVAGLLALVAGFLVSVPLSAANVAWVVALQVNRVFWLLDGVVFVYLALWLVDDLAARRRWQPAAALLLVVLSMGRGFYVLAYDARRPLVQATLPAGAWTDALTWVRSQPGRWTVLADPGHAWKYGSSVRVGALRDAVLEQSKDTAVAIYSRDIALQVVDRMHALSGFEAMGAADLRALGARYHADVVILDRHRAIDLPELYGNPGFVVYDLRK